MKDEGHSGAYLERPGLDHVRDLVEEGAGALVVAQDADRLTRDPGHRLLLDEEFDKRGCRLQALDGWGDDSHEGQLLKFLRGWVSQGERLKIAERTRRGKRQKTKQGRLSAPSTVPYGFRLNPERDGYLGDEKQMAVVRRIFQMVADGAGLRGAKRALESEGVPSPAGDKLWNRTTIRGIIKKDAYYPHSHAEAQHLVTPDVAARLDPELSYGIAWASRHSWKVVRRERRPDGSYHNVHKYEERPREECIALPVPGSGVPREVAERARHAVEIQVTEPRNGQRVWELSCGLLRCAECGRSMGA